MSPTCNQEEEGPSNSHSCTITIGYKYSWTIAAQVKTIIGNVHFKVYRSAGLPLFVRNPLFAWLYGCLSPLQNISLRLSSPYRRAACPARNTAHSWAPWRRCWARRGCCCNSPGSGGSCCSSCLDGRTTFGTRYRQHSDSSQSFMKEYNKQRKAGLVSWNGWDLLHVANTMVHLHVHGSRAWHVSGGSKIRDCGI